jgi:hypothetical protein
MNELRGMLKGAFSNTYALSLHRSNLASIEFLTLLKKTVLVSDRDSITMVMS